MAAAENILEEPGLDTPTWGEVLTQLLSASKRQIPTWFPGRARDFDLSKKTVTVDCELDLGGDTPPPLPNVPVLWAGGVYWDIDNGEPGIVLVGWRNFQNWLLTGNRSVPQDDGVHDKANCCFVPGLWPFPMAQEMTLSPGTKVIPLDMGLLKLLLADAAAAQGLIRGSNFYDRMDDLVSGLYDAWVAAETAVPDLAPAAAIAKAAILLFRTGFPSDVSDEVFIP
jgi:hypothetical protein